MKRFILTILLLLYVVSVYATTYYFSTSGLTGNTGTDTLHTWPLSKFYSTTFGSGDILLFHKNQTFTGTGTFSRSGSSGSTITITSYGNGNNPIIDAGASSSPCITLTGSYVTVSNIVFQNSTASTGLIYINGGNASRDITFSNCYFNTGVRGLYVSQVIGNINILHNYFTLISDPNINPNGGGSKVQVWTCTLTVGAVTIRGNQSYEPTRNNGIGDQYSLYKCFGTSSFWFLCDSNQTVGGSSNLAGFANFTQGDNGGSFQSCTNNIGVNTGSAGMACGGVTTGIISNNRFYSAQFPDAAAGIIIGNYIGATNTNITCANNNLTWHNSANAIDNIFLDTGSGYTATPTGYSTNTPPGTADPLATATMLPATLWTGSPWNSPIIFYSPAYALTIGGIVNKSPTNTGTASTNWTCSPTLPAGLSINSGTGQITGIPTTTSLLTTYTVSATNAKGTGTYQFTAVVTGGSGHLFHDGHGHLIKRWH